jgi:transposase
MPLLHYVSEKMGLRDILSRYIKKHGNERVDPVSTLLLLIYNLALGKAPLYELQNWTDSLDLRRIGISASSNVWTDDRFGKALDKLYDVDRASLMTELVEAYVETFSVHLDQLHNDSTTVKAYGRIAGITDSGLELKYGISKDHRNDLKQLVFNLSLTADGGVPIHHRCYPGNYTDDKTHIHTWSMLRKLSGKADFLYVADSKVCTDPQLHEIVGCGGRVITIMPETWKDTQTFKAQLRMASKPKRIIWRRIKPGSDCEKEYFSIFTGSYYTHKRGYRIHWIYSSEKRKRDRLARENALEKAEQQLAELNAKINTRKFSSRRVIRQAVEQILHQRQVTPFVTYTISMHSFSYQKQIGRGRPTKQTRCRTVRQKSYSLSWRRNRECLIKESRIDGIFPLLSTDTTLPPLKVLQAYKYQPRLEKRFTQFKSIHNAAPLLFKKIERVEANMFVFFIALALQALIERQVRNNMSEEQITRLYIYPEDRECIRPTASIIFDRFETMSNYHIIQNGVIVEGFRDNLSSSQKEILGVFRMTESEYWRE